MLASAVVHYFHQYMPGLIYVAVSRCAAVVKATPKDRFDKCEEDDKLFTFPSDVLDGPMLQCSEDEDVAAPQELLDVYKASVNSSKSTRRILIKSRDHLLAMNASPSLIASTLLEEKYRAVNFLLTDNYWLKIEKAPNVLYRHGLRHFEVEQSASSLPLLEAYHQHICHLHAKNEQLKKWKILKSLVARQRNWQREELKFSDFARNFSF
ncbi:hypothetical protein pdam_00021130 [Pocillopora damicornis]|uniref:Uncharacterized protein n=1 Tax=Pocillopora damicornis TaxID=46731 RepID=A0A3M6V407_POCDA|nr:hypothetical protein pdam_00021130 [Pocillopora damicornis]